MQIRKLRGWIVAAFVCALAAPAWAADADGDGLTDADETSVWTTNPNNANSDGDAWTDGDEVLLYGTSPTMTDTDGDGTADDADSQPLYAATTTYGGGNNATFTNKRTGPIQATSGLSPYDGVGVLLVEGSLHVGCDENDSGLIA